MFVKVAPRPVSNRAELSKQEGFVDSEAKVVRAVSSKFTQSSSGHLLIEAVQWTQKRGAKLFVSSTFVLIDAFHRPGAIENTSC